LRSSLKWIRLAAVDAEPKGPNSNPEPYVPNSIDRVIVVAIALGSFAWGIRSGFRTAEFATDHRGDQDAGRFAAPKSATAADFGEVGQGGRTGGCARGTRSRRPNPTGPSIVTSSKSLTRADNREANKLEISPLHQSEST
jgi:hypothetical protein